MSAVVSQFPFATLEALSRADIEATAKLRAFSRDYVELSKLSGALAEVLGERVEFSEPRYRNLALSHGDHDAVGIVFELFAGQSRVVRVLVELESALAVAIVSRGLRQRVPRIIDVSRGVPAPVAGALAAIFATALRRAYAKVMPRVADVGSAISLAQELHHRDPELVAGWSRIVVGDEAFEMRFRVPARALRSPVAPRLSRQVLSGLGDCQISLPLVWATTTSTRAELEQLEVGDAFLPTGTSARRSSDGSLIGPVALLAARAERGLGAELADGGRLVLRDFLESHPWTQESRMSSETALGVTLEALEDAPIVVRVELGAVSMTAREWGALGPGDVIALGRRIGDEAILRAGGAEIARGELVQVDGEYGVRITALRTGKARGDER
jgi:type III secretion system YscQ/HrcQ family protein